MRSAGEVDGSCAIFMPTSLKIVDGVPDEPGNVPKFCRMYCPGVMLTHPPGRLPGGVNLKSVLMTVATPALESVDQGYPAVNK